MDTSDGNIIIVFDGYCILCDNFVKWIAKKDKDYKIHFTTFESNYINKNYPAIKLKNSVVVIDSNNNLFKKSEAVILCLKTIKCSKILISVFEIIPKTILDIGYSLVAYFRYKIFGKKKICSLPNTIISERILS
jgi:predicted DCC family thiol-disulfide oxidoreductase YuxK